MDLTKLSTDALYSERDAAWYNLQSLTPGDAGYRRAEGQLTAVKLEINRRIARQLVAAARLSAA